MLTLEERNALQAAISKRNDIVAALPFEVALAVFDQLDPLDVWRLRSVSTRWHARLSSTKFIDSAISRWNTHDPSDAPLASASSASRPRESSIRHIQAVQDGKPTSFKQLVITDRMDYIRFKGQYIAYTLFHDGYTAVLHNICTGWIETYRDEARQYIGDVILTSTLFAFTTAGGVLYWKRLSESKESIEKVQLPSAMDGIAGGDGDLIAMLADRRRFYALDETIELLTFDACTLQLRSQAILIDDEVRNTRRLEGSLLIDAAKRIADIFYLRREQGTLKLDTRIQHIRISLDGSVLQQQDVQIPPFPGPIYHPPPQSIGSRGLYAVCFRPERRTPGVRLIFDSDRGTLITDPDLASVISAEKAACALWKGSMFCAAKAQASQYSCEMRSFGRTVTIDAATGHKLHGR